MPPLGQYFSQVRQKRLAGADLGLAAAFEAARMPKTAPTVLPIAASAAPAMPAIAARC